MTSGHDLAQQIVARAKAKGAAAAEAMVVEATSLSATCRLGKLEDVDRSEAIDLGVRILEGAKQGLVSSNRLTADAIDRLVDRALAMARAAPEDPYACLAPADRLATTVPELDLDDGEEPASERLIERAGACEAAALAEQGITNSEGASAGWSRGTTHLVTSEGFAGGYSRSSHSVSCSVLAGSGTAMESDYDFSSKRHLAELRAPEAIGREAARRALRKLNPRKVDTQTVPVVFDPRVARSLLGHFASAINGAAIARGTSFLKDALDNRIFANGLAVVDDPHIRRGLSSKPYDAEGVANQRRRLVEQGTLKTWLLDCATARQLKRESTGHAARGAGGLPSPAPTNLYFEAGSVSPEELMSDIKSGLYVTDLIGMGVNLVTGDYSRGAGGFWIENGEIAYPVSELTIAGNLKDMFARLVLADDLVFDYGTNSPTLRIDGVTVAGK